MFEKVIPVPGRLIPILSNRSWSFSIGFLSPVFIFFYIKMTLAQFKRSVGLKYTVFSHEVLHI